MISETGGSMVKRLSLVLFLIAFSLPSTAFATAIEFSAAGADATAIQGTVTAFQAALGNPNNGNMPGPLGSGRREINWDGGGTATTPAGTPFEGFENIRGAEFTTPAPGTGFVQAPPSGGAGGGLATVFGNATYGTIFTTFSSPRLFVPVGGNITDVLFSIPGTSGASPAVVSGFGAVFTDVDLANTTTLQFFNLFNQSLGVFNVPVANNGLSFLGVAFNAGEAVARVRITTGNSALGPNDGGGIDVVAMDDFLYSEPQTVVPEPATLWLVGAGMLAAARRLRRRA
jgi:hypothetical protein